MALRFVLALILACGLARSVAAQNLDVDTSNSNRLDVAETLLGIIGYTRWPADPNPVRLCVAGQSPHAERLLRQGLDNPGQRPVAVRKAPADPAEVSAQCDVLYIGALDDGTWRRIFSNINGQPVLTVCERSPVCLVGGMVCLDIDTQSRVRFEINLDSVARGTVRINPQVLRLGRRPAKGML